MANPVQKVVPSQAPMMKTPAVVQPVRAKAAFTPTAQPTGKLHDSMGVVPGRPRVAKTIAPVETVAHPPAKMAAPSPAAPAVFNANANASFKRTITPTPVKAQANSTKNDAHAYMHSMGQRAHGQLGRHGYAPTPKTTRKAI